MIRVCTAKLSIKRCHEPQSVLLQFEDVFKLITGSQQTNVMIKLDDGAT